MGPQQDNDAGTKSNDNNNSTPLYVRYPVLSVWEFVLNPNQTQVQGTVYCVNVPSQTIWLLPVGVATATDTPHLNDTTELRLIHVKAIAQSKLLQPAPTSPESSKRLQLPTEPVSLKALQDRERRALRQAEESFLHMNDKVRIYLPNDKKETKINNLPWEKREESSGHGNHIGNDIHSGI